MGRLAEVELDVALWGLAGGINSLTPTGGHLRQIHSAGNYSPSCSVMGREKAYHHAGPSLLIFRPCLGSFLGPLSPCQPFVPPQIRASAQMPPSHSQVCCEYDPSRIQGESARASVAGRVPRRGSFRESEQGWKAEGDLALLDNSCPLVRTVQVICMD